MTAEQLKTLARAMDREAQGHRRRWARAANRRDHVAAAHSQALAWGCENEARRLRALAQATGAQS